MVHIVWKGYGILVGFAGFLGLLLADHGATLFTNDSSYYADHPEPKLCGGLLAAALAFVAVKLVEKRHPPTVYINQNTRQETVSYHNDSLFFVPIRFLPYTFLALAAFFAYGPLLFGAMK